MTPLPPHIAKIRGPQYQHLLFASGTSKVGTHHSLNWLQFCYVMQMAGHEQVSNKLNSKLFAPWSPRAGATGRTSDAVDQMAMPVFDLDKIDTLDIDTVLSWCGPYAALVHTTFSHGENGRGCFRVYMSLVEPIEASLYKAVHFALLATLPELACRVDPSCGDFARCYFMPSCPPERHHLAGVRMCMSGKEVNAAALLATTIAPTVMVQSKMTLIPAFSFDAASSQAVAALMPSPAIEGCRNQTLTSATGRVYAKGFTPEALLPEALNWGRRCTPPMEDAEVVAIVNSMWRTHSRNNSNTGQLQADDISGAAFTPKYLLTAQELMQLPPLAWCVRGVIPERGLCSIYGASGSGKTFLALDLACAIASKDRWFGQPVKRAPVVYVALEGEAGISQRMQAWQKHHGQEAPEQLRFVIRHVSLMEPGECESLAKEIIVACGAGTVIFIDTLNRAAPTADENTSGDMGRVIESAKTLADVVNGMVILVHHSGKDSSRGMRGHSSLFAAMDAVIEVTRSATGREWGVSKSKDSGDGIKHGFDLEQVKLGLDSWGMELTSCAVNPATPGRSMPTMPVRGKHQTRAYEVLSGLLRNSQANPVGIERTEAETAVARMLNCDPRRAPERARDAIADLIRRGHFVETDGRITHP